MCNHFTKLVAGTIASAPKKNTAEIVNVLIHWKPIFTSACVVV